MKYWPRQEYVFVLLDDSFNEEKAIKKYVEDLGKQQHIFTWFHGTAPAVAQPKHNTLQDENKVVVTEFRP